MKKPPKTTAEMAEKAITYLKRHPQNLPSLSPHFTPEAATHLLLTSQKNKSLILKFLNWAQPLPFFTPHCKTLTLHILTRFNLFNTAQTLAQNLITTTTPSLVFNLLKETYHSCNSSSSVFDLLIKSYSQLNLIDNAIHTLHLANRHGFSPGVLSYNSILDSILRGGSHPLLLIQHANRVFGDMIRKNVSPNIYTYNVMIRGIVSAGNWSLVSIS
jgi:hypothetical protein